MPLLRQSKGFTLVELAIVIAIIGLLVGGIMAGTALQHNAELAKIVTDAKSYTLAINQFRDKYGYLAGDFPYATQVWGRADGGTPVTTNCATPALDAAVPSGTCNGTGDGMVASQTVNYGELTRAWQQLQLAGFMTGNLTGTSMSTAASYMDFQAGVDLPAGSISNSAYQFLSYGQISGNPSFFDGFYNGAILLGTRTLSAGGYQYVSATLKPEEAYQIDLKYDDGMPGLGSIRAPKSNAWFESGTCTTTNVETTSNYKFTYKDVGCTPIFMQDFLIGNKGR